MDIKNELSQNQVVLLLMPGIEYNNVIGDIAKQLSGKNICYVTLNKTYDALKEFFSKKKVDTGKIMFIDAISKTIKKVPDQTAGCYFVSSPGALTEISISIDRFLKHGFDYLIFDSLTNLLIYQKRAPVAMFVSSIINKIRGSKTKAVFYALSVKEQEELITESGMFVDKVIDLGKGF